MNNLLEIQAMNHLLAVQAMNHPLEVQAMNHPLEVQAMNHPLEVHAMNHPLEVLNTNKLRRLPHVFSSLLQLPFPAHADVSVQEDPHCFQFVADTVQAQLEAHIVQIHPGLTKVVVRKTGSFDDLDLDLDVWRVRLPQSTLPELTTAAVVAGELVVTVPKT